MQLCPIIFTINYPIELKIEADRLVVIAALLNHCEFIIKYHYWFIFDKLIRHVQDENSVEKIIAVIGIENVIKNCEPIKFLNFLMLDTQYFIIARKILNAFKDLQNIEKFNALHVFEDMTDHRIPRDLVINILDIFHDGSSTLCSNPWLRINDDICLKILKFGIPKEHKIQLLKETFDLKFLIQ
jgi:hypothetical protein